MRRYVVCDAAVADESGLHSLGDPVESSVVRQRSENVRVEHHQRRLPESAGEVFACVEVDSRFAAYRRIDRGQQCRRYLDEFDASEVRRGCETGHIADDAAAQCDEHVASREAVVCQEVQDICQRVERLGLFAAFEYESVKLEARICERSPELAVLCAVEGSDVSVGNDTELFASAGDTGVSSSFAARLSGAVRRNFRSAGGAALHAPGPRHESLRPGVTCSLYTS